MIASKLPADARRAVNVEAVISLAGSQNPSDIKTQGALTRAKPVAKFRQTLKPALQPPCSSDHSGLGHGQIAAP